MVRDVAGDEDGVRAAVHGVDVRDDPRDAFRGSRAPVDMQIADVGKQHGSPWELMESEALGQRRWAGEVGLTAWG
ncbi:hypothetical protein GCM10010394_60150 [Streptomyces crystallinus]|uniref:Uncharacterized protein n=1 Tax=Streptomyces crystallinus TaxID=68191 RepID=A0ABP3RYW3_9ACTN